MGTGSGKAYAKQDQGGGFEAIEPGPGQVLIVNSNSVVSSAFSDKTTIIRLFSTVDCFLAFGNSSPTVVNSSYFLPGGFIDFVGVNAKTQIAVTRSLANGLLYLTEGG